jgi:hypothetical protein
MLDHRAQRRNRRSDELRRPGLERKRCQGTHRRGTIMPMTFAAIFVYEVDLASAEAFEAASTWEKTGDSGAWEHDFDMRYVKTR